MSQVKVSLSPYLIQIVDSIAEQMGRSRTDVTALLLFRIETLLRNGKAEPFGLEWIEASAIVNAKGHGARHTDPVMLAGGELVNFDIKLLETGGKSKTGFVGVHATTGNSFRALVPDPTSGGTKYLTSRPTALKAAIDRYEWFERYGIPYGNVGINVDDTRKQHPEWTTEQCLIQVRDLMKGAGLIGLKNPYTLEQAEHALARYRAANGITVDREETRDTSDFDHRPRDKAPAPLDKVFCVICLQEIIENEPFSPQGKEDYAHTACL